MKPSTLRLSCLFVLCLAAITSPAHAYEEAAVSNGGTIAGKVTYLGRIPERTIAPTSDREVCGTIRKVPMVHRGPDNGVERAVVYLQQVDRGKPWPAEATEVAPVIDNVGCEFKPHVQVMPPGPVDIHNSDAVLHNTKAYYGRRAAFNLALPDKDMTIRRELTRPGVVRLECDAHGWMEGWVYVLEHPYYALTAEDGSFTIGEVPPGDYVLIARQEYVGTVEQAVTVAPGATVEVAIELKQ
jgi:hypothetical protein